MRKLITIDCWNTILVSSQSSKLVKLEVSRKLNVLYEDFTVIFDKVRNLPGALISQEIFCAKLLEELAIVGDPFELAKYINDLYDNMYSPQLHNYTGIIDILQFAEDMHWEVRILSNTGYLSTKQLQQYLSTSLYPYPIKVVGSDVLGVSKPDSEFYRLGTLPFSKDNWIHIGDSKTLDIEPVLAMGAEAYQIINVSSWAHILKQLRDSTQNQ